MSTRIILYITTAVFPYLTMC